MASRAPMMVFPSKTKLAVYFVAQALVLAGCLVGCAWFAVTPPSQTGTVIGAIPALPLVPLCLILTVILLGAVWVSVGYRLVVRKPAVTITDAGLIDDCSFLICGVGLIRWHDMQAVYATRYSNSTTFIHIKRSYVVICLRDQRGFFQQQSSRIRCLHFVFTQLMFSPHIFIPQYMVSSTADYIWGTSQTYYEMRRRHDQELQSLPELAFSYPPG